MERNKQDSITCWRGIGCLCIIIYHYCRAYFEYVQEFDLGFFDIGWLTYAVPMFFVLSSMFLFKKANELLNPIKLIIYRLVRLWPAYAMGVILSSFLRICILNDTISPKMFLGNLFMIEDVLGVGKIDGVYWTLEYELFLLLIISCISFGGKKGDKFFLSHPEKFCEIWLFIGVVGQILFKIFGIDSSTMQLVFFAMPYIPVFVCGILFYSIYIKKVRINIDFWICISVSLLYQIIFLPMVTAAIGIFAVLIIYLNMSEYMKKNILVNNNFFAFLGQISYPLYLCHNTIGIVVCKKYCVNNHYLNLLYVLLAACVSICVAFLISLVEKRVIIKIKKLSLYKKIFE